QKESNQEKKQCARDHRPRSRVLVIHETKLAHRREDVSAGEREQGDGATKRSVLEENGTSRGEYWLAADWTSEAHCGPGSSRSRPCCGLPPPSSSASASTDLPQMACRARSIRQLRVCPMKPCPMKPWHLLG